LNFGDVTSPEALNQIAVRKIIKKFDKRFHVSWRKLVEERGENGREWLVNSFDSYLLKWRRGEERRGEE